MNTYCTEAAARYRGKPGTASDFFNDQDIELMAELMSFRKVEAGAYLFWDGDPANYMYWIQGGLAKLRKSTDTGKDLLLSIVQHGDIIVELGPQATHRYSAEAMEPLQVGVIDRNELEKLLRQNGELAYKFALWLGHQQRIADSRLRDLLLNGKHGALASTLIRLVQSFGVTTANGIRLDIKLTNTEIAELAGTTRENVNRMLSAMKDEGTIELQCGRIMIHSLAALQNLAGCPDCPGCQAAMCRI